MSYRTVVSISKNAVTTDVGLLLLRASLGLSLFLKHGLEKLTHFTLMAQVFPDPFHFGSHLSFGIAVMSDVLAALLLIGGIVTRAAALFISCNIGVAWLFVHHALFFAPNADHGELCILYICGCVSLVFTGAGRFSADAFLSQLGVA